MVMTVGYVDTAAGAPAFRQDEDDDEDNQEDEEVEELPRIDIGSDDGL